MGMFAKGVKHFSVGKSSSVLGMCIKAVNASPALSASYPVAVTPTPAWSSFTGQSGTGDVAVQGAAFDRE